MAAGTLALVVVASVFGRAQTRADYCAPSNWPSPQRNVTKVRNLEGLERALRDARPGDVIQLERGRYALSQSISVAVPDLTLRGSTGDPADVVLSGDGMTGGAVGIGVAVSAPGVTVSGVTIGQVKYHAIQVRGESGASRFTLHHARLVDTGQQLFKVSVSSNGQFPDDGTVACSELAYTDTAPSNYTNGVDILAGKGWTVRNNRFFHIRGPESDRWRAGPAVLAWAGSEGTVVEGNLIVDSFRGIALGLGAGSSSVARPLAPGVDHAGGVIRHNTIVNLHEWADEAIEANAATDVQIERNTVLVTGNVGWSIGVRFPTASAAVRNNLTNRPLLRRDGGRAEESGNIANATADWFVDPAHGDMRISERGGAVIRGAAVGALAGVGQSAP